MNKQIEELLVYLNQQFDVTVGHIPLKDKLVALHNSAIIKGMEMAAEIVRPILNDHEVYRYHGGKEALDDILSAADKLKKEQTK